MSTSVWDTGYYSTIARCSLKTIGNFYIFLIFRNQRENSLVPLLELFINVVSENWGFTSLEFKGN